MAITKVPLLDRDAGWPRDPRWSTHMGSFGIMGAEGAD